MFDIVIRCSQPTSLANEIQNESSQPGKIYIFFKDHIISRCFPRNQIFPRSQIYVVYGKQLFFYILAILRCLPWLLIQFEFQDYNVDYNFYVNNAIFHINTEDVIGLRYQLCCCHRIHLNIFPQVLFFK